LLIYFRIKWPAPPSACHLAWEAKLATVVDLSVKYDEQVVIFAEATEDLKAARASHYKEGSNLDDLWFELDEAKKALKAQSLD